MIFRLIQAAKDWKNFVHHFAIFGLRIGGILLSYVFATIVIKNYGTDTWGVFTLTISIISISVLFGKFGFDTVMLKYSSLNKNDFHFIKLLLYKFGWFCCVISLVFTLLFYFFSDSIAVEFFHNNTLVIFLKSISICTIPYVLFLIFSEILRGQGKSIEYTFIQSTGLYGFASLFLFVGIYLFDDKSVSTVAWSFVAAVFVLFAFGLLQLFTIPNSIKSVPKTPSFYTLLGLGWPLFLSNASIVLFEWSDTLFLGFFGKDIDESVTNSIIGSYNICYKISNFVNIPLVIVSSIIASHLGTHFKNNEMDTLKRTLHKNGKILLYSTIAASIILIVFSGVLLDFFSIEDSNVNLAVLLILVLGQIINNLAGPTDLLLLLSGHEKKYQQFVLIAVVVNLSANIILIPIIGPIGAAIANLLFRASWNLMSLRFIIKEMNLNPCFLPISKS
jgi:O-antigen/teichoic acid export membrane protein